MVSTLPQHPWQVVGADLFELNNTMHLLVVDYFSRFPEIIKLSPTTSPLLQLLNLFSQDLAFLRHFVLIMVHNVFAIF